MDIVEKQGKLWDDVLKTFANFSVLYRIKKKHVDELEKHVGEKIINELREKYRKEYDIEAEKHQLMSSHESFEYELVKCKKVFTRSPFL